MKRRNRDYDLVNENNNKKAKCVKSEEKNIKNTKNTKNTPNNSPKTIILSREQKEIVDDICKKKNVLCNSKAGCGKTSVSLAAAKQFYDKYKAKTLLITYNSRLKTETRDRIKELKLEDAVQCHSYHALAYKYFLVTHNGNPDDSLIHGAMQVMPNEELDFGLVIIDEAQDMNELYYKFTLYVLKHLKSKPTMLIVADIFQRLFGFNGATDAFLQEPKKYFGELCHLPDFVTHYLSISWRISHEMAAFINTNLNPCNLSYSHAEWWERNRERITSWWGKGIRANPKRRPDPNSVKVIRGWGSREVVKETKKLFDLYGNDEVALLSFSLKGEKTPIRAIVDKLGKGENENWCVLDGKGGTSEEVMKGKRVASTIHRMKGLERRGIVVCGLDAFIEKLYIHDPLEHFNIFYVACTRAKDQLIINITGTDYATIRCSPLLTNKSNRQCCEIQTLCEYVPFDDILSVPENLFQAKVRTSFPEKALALDRQSCLVEGRTPGTLEDLSPFLSRAISLRLMLRIQKQLFQIPIESFSNHNRFDHDMVDFVKQFYTTPHNLITWPALVRYAIGYETMKSNYLHLWRQLTDYESFTPVDLLQKCTDNAFNLLWKHAKDQKLVPGHVEDPIEQEYLLKPLVEFEIPISFPFYLPWFTTTYTGQISGSVDIVFNKNTIIGLECSNSVPAERGLELSMYSAIKHLLSLPRFYDTKLTPINSFKTMMILTNTAQLVNIDLKLKPTNPIVPVEYELIHRVVRRKMQLPAADSIELTQDFQGKQKTSIPKPDWMKGVIELDSSD
jgi:hypothetical protein